VTAAPAGAVNLFGGGGGGGGGGASATAGVGVGGGGPCTAGAGVGAGGAAAVVGAFEDPAAAGVPSGFTFCVGAALWVGAGAGAGGELLQPLSRRVAERAKLVARYIDFEVMIYLRSRSSGCAATY
jgi:hypothetical protein